MKNKLAVYVSITVGLLTLGLVSIHGTLQTPATSNEFEIAKNLSIFSNIYKELDIFYVDDIQTGKLMKEGIDGMLASLDPYTNYIPESAIEDFRVQHTGKYGGIGAQIIKRDEYVMIAEPHEGFPAQKAGLRAGDLIVKVDDVDTKDMNAADMSELLKGQAGTELTVKIKRPGTDATFETVITREVVKIPDVPYYGMLDESIGYIKLNSFTENASSDVESAFKKLRRDSGMTKIVLDLRDNGGGLLREAVEIVNFFVPNGQTVVETKGKLSEMNKVYKAQLKPIDLDIPVVVLINGRSASASEIVAGSLQDLDRGVVIGETSFGKGLVQQTRNLDFNSKLKLTIAKYYTPSGRCIQKLDYSNRKDGKVSAVADSLRSSFKTPNNRIVKDGRGIEPDIKIVPPTLNNLTAILMVKYLLFDFATEYRQKNTSLPNARSFRVDDDLYAEFIQFLDGKEYEYTSESEDRLKELKEIAIREKYFEESKEDYERLLNKFRSDKSKDLQKFKDEIAELLGQEIVGRYYFQNGKVAHILELDPNIDTAISILNDSSRYRKTLGFSN